MVAIILSPGDCDLTEPILSAEQDEADGPSDQPV